MIEAVARDAAEMRSELTRYLRAYAPTRWSQMIRTGVEFTIPEAWSILSPSKLAANLVRAERDRIEDTPFYALDPEVSAAAVQAGVAGIILTPDALPAPSGSIYFHHPVAESGPHRAGPARIVTWGAPPPSMGLPGLWLTWYADLRESKDPAVAAMQPDARIVLDQENFLRFLPAIDDRLIPGEPPATETARILRTVLLALFAIKDGLLPTREINAPPAGNEGCIVHVASAPGEDPSELPRAMVRAATRHSEDALRLVLGEE